MLIKKCNLRNIFYCIVAITNTVKTIIEKITKKYRTTKINLEK